MLDCRSVALLLCAIVEAGGVGRPQPNSKPFEDEFDIADDEELDAFSDVLSKLLLLL